METGVELGLEGTSPVLRMSGNACGYKSEWHKLTCPYYIGLMHYSTD